MANEPNVIVDMSEKPENVMTHISKSIIRMSQFS